jgi:hypothetical protein
MSAYYRCLAARRSLVTILPFDEGEGAGITCASQLESRGVNTLLVVLLWLCPSVKDFGELRLTEMEMMELVEMIAGARMPPEEGVRRFDDEGS